MIKASVKKCNKHRCASGLLRNCANRGASVGRSGGQAMRLPRDGALLQGNTPALHRIPLRLPKCTACFCAAPKEAN